MKHWKQLNKAEFTRIKTMLNAGIKPGMIVKVTNRSWPVVSNIQKCDSLEAYRMELNKDREPKKQDKEIESFQKVNPNERFPRLVALLDTIVKQQLLMSQDLDKIKKRLVIWK